MIDETKFMLKFNKECQDNKTYMGYRIKQAIGKIIFELEKEKEELCPDCQGKGYSLKQGCLVATRISCRYCDGTGKANTKNPTNKNKEVSK